jgi:hypothetical protein
LQHVRRFRRRQGGVGVLRYGPGDLDARVGERPVALVDVENPLEMRFRLARSGRWGIESLPLGTDPLDGSLRRRPDRQHVQTAERGDDQ